MDSIFEIDLDLLFCDRTPLERRYGSAVMVNWVCRIQYSKLYDRKKDAYGSGFTGDSGGSPNPTHKQNWSKD